MIFKLQLSQNDGGRKVLIYNQDRSIFRETRTNPELLALFGGKPKVYVKANMTGNEFVPIGVVPDQSW